MEVLIRKKSKTKHKKTASTFEMEKYVIIHPK